MPRAYQLIVFTRQDDILCVRLKDPHVEDTQMEDLGAELSRLTEEEQIKKVVMCLGPEEPDCLISVFLAKLISLQRRLSGLGGELVLAHVSDHTRGIFRAAGIEKLFQFYVDENSAVAALQAPG